MQWRSQWLVAARILPVLQQATVLVLVPVLFLMNMKYHTESEEEKDQERRTVVSLLDRLKSASAADIARPRKTKKE